MYTRMLMVAVALAVLLGPLAAGAQQPSPCQGVTCSNHGTCVVKGGEPVCACHEGYYPDQTTGLSCLPLGVQPGQPIRGGGGRYAPVQPGRIDTGGDEELRRTERALGRNLSSEWARYQQYVDRYERSGAVFRGSFPEMLQRRFQVTRDTGIGLFAAVWPGLAVLSLAPWLAGETCYEDEWDYYCEMSAEGLAFGIILDVMSFAAFVSGIVLWAVGQARMNRLDYLVREYSAEAEPPALEITGLRLMQDREGRPEGLVLGFSF